MYVGTKLVNAEVWLGKETKMAGALMRDTGGIVPWRHGRNRGEVPALQFHQGTAYPTGNFPLLEQDACS